jgi:hypothetical protein
MSDPAKAVTTREFVMARRRSFIPSAPPDDGLRQYLRLITEPHSGAPYRKVRLRIFFNQAEPCNGNRLQAAKAGSSRD